MQEFFHVTPISNMDLILSVGLIPQIGERSEGVEEEALVCLFRTYEDCETALLQWLGEEFEELEEELVILKVQLPNDFPLIQTSEWEVVSKINIGAQYISFYKNEG
ncbi:hypothetical protein ACOMCU_01975 [Lysinibacillus sp. UGB7]|uniref:hypothetical protein n=1 Tax=Lysinibacillus sp. UGB7 TaxID=3411039 RepID=UPI003B7EFF63